MYQAQRYHKDFASPMAVVNDAHIFINDFVVFYHEIFCKIIGKVIKFFMKVKYMYIMHSCTCINVIRNHTMHY